MSHEDQLYDMPGSVEFGRTKGLGRYLQLAEGLAGAKDMTVENLAYRSITLLLKEAKPGDRLFHLTTAAKAVISELDGQVIPIELEPQKAI